MTQGWLGRALYGIRAGDEKLAYNQLFFGEVPETLKLASTDFADGGAMPRRFAGRGVGQNIAPALNWSGVPSHAAQLVLIIEDPDVPLPWPFVHLLAYGIAAKRSGFASGELNGAADLKFGRNTLGPPGYGGPRALVGHGPHRYHFQLFALARPIELADGARRHEILRQMRGNTAARGRLIGYFEQSAE